MIMLLLYLVETWRIFRYSNINDYVAVISGRNLGDLQVVKYFETQFFEYQKANN